MPKYNLGRKPKEVTTEAPMQDKEIYYPSISISTEDAKGLELKMGQKVKLVGVVTGVDEHKKDDEKKETRYNIDVEQLNEGISEEEYMEKDDDEKDKIDEDELKNKAEEKEE